ESIWETRQVLEEEIFAGAEGKPANAAPASGQPAPAPEETIPLPAGAAGAIPEVLNEALSFLDLIAPPGGAPGAGSDLLPGLPAAEPGPGQGGDPSVRVMAPLVVKPMPPQQ